ncbi:MULTISPECIES: GDSL-type esterase/lipase family protein [Paenibacillus]|uniref:Lipase n=1 Tax=Paenibacillus validus TaxID=44253 RepID=A0A7X2ZCY8_9BACL|nr:GDSL-type esterase/lipase family protein [Paenibacillus validus]MUG72675.1 lipase [Paenibacillus validus]
MSSTRWLWRSVGFGALLSTAVCAAGFAYAVNQIIFPQAASGVGTGFVGTVPAPAANEGAAAPSEPQSGQAWEAKTQIRIAALGDSLTAGTGDITGKGYVRSVRDKLEQRLGKPVYVYNNFAIPGFRTTDLLKDWEAKKDIARSISESDLVLLTIGGNDLFQGGEGIFNAPNDQAGQASKPDEANPGEGTDGRTAAPVPSGSDVQLGEAFNPQAALTRMPEALQRLEQIIDRVSKANPNARVLYVGLYHPFLDIDKDRAGAPIIQRWNTAAFEIASRYPNVTVVPTYDLFELQGSKYLYTDHFHPNQQGYERIAERIADILQ